MHQFTELSQRVMESDVVVYGTISDIKAFELLEDDMIFTSYSINIDTWFGPNKIPESGQIEFVQPGGILGDRGVSVNPYLALSEGDEGYFLLRYYKGFHGGIRGELSPVDAGLSLLPKLQRKGGVADQGNAYSHDHIHRLIREIKGWTPQVQERSKPASNSRRMVPSISSFSPTSVSAGTNTKLTVNGSGFGTQRGRVIFKNADSGGANNMYNPWSIISWTDTKIEVNVPYGAGTGQIYVGGYFSCQICLEQWNFDCRLQYFTSYPN